MRRDVLVSRVFGALLLLAACSLLQPCAAVKAAARRSLPPPGAPKGRAPAALDRARHHRAPCLPDDARCIGLRDHVCDPYFVNVTDK